MGLPMQKSQLPTYDETMWNERETEPLRGAEEQSAEPALNPGRPLQTAFSDLDPVSPAMPVADAIPDGMEKSRKWKFWKRGPAKRGRAI